MFIIFSFLKIFFLWFCKPPFSPFLQMFFINMNVFMYTSMLSTIKVAQILPWKMRISQGRWDGDTIPPIHKNRVLNPGGVRLTIIIEHLRRRVKTNLNITESRERSLLIQ